MEIRKALREEAIVLLASQFASNGVASVDGLTFALVTLAEVSFSSEEMTWNASQALLSASQVLVDAAISGAFELTYDQITLIMDREDCCDPERVKNVYLTALNSTLVPIMIKC